MKRYLQSATIVFILFVLFQIILPVPRIEAQAKSGVADDWSLPLSPWQDYKVGSIGYGDIIDNTRHGGLDVWLADEKSRDYGGQPVYAMADGVVSYFCNPEPSICGGFGKAVLISHNLPSDRAYEGETRVTSVYGHLDGSKKIVKEGTVKKGDIIGYLAPTGNCGSKCDFAHLPFGIRRGHYGDPGFPSGGWGYVPISDEKEFSQWIEPLGFIRDRAKFWQAQTPQTLTINFPWVYNFSTCDLRPIRVRLGNELLFSSAPGDEKPVRSFGKFLWFGTYTLNVEYYDLPNTPSVKVEWPPAPNRLACSAETTFPTPTPTTTRTPIGTVTPSPSPFPTATSLIRVSTPTLVELQTNRADLEIMDLFLSYSPTPPTVNGCPIGIWTIKLRNNGPGNLVNSSAWQSCTARPNGITTTDGRTMTKQGNQLLTIMSGQVIELGTSIRLANCGDANN